MSDIYDYVISNLPLGYNYGNDNTVVKNNIPNHKAWKQSLREDYPGDVGVFMINNEYIEYFHGVAYKNCSIQVALVCVNGDINNGIKYFEELFNNIKNNKTTDYIKIARASLINIIPMGKNNIGNQMVETNILFKYVDINN